MTDLSGGAEISNAYGDGRRVYRFDNGYGASIIEGGNPFAEFELMVLSFHDNEEGDITCDTPVAADWERGDADDMRRLLSEIEALPRRSR